MRPSTPHSTIISIAVTDFQSIADATIECGPWVSLVGESDVGKSAIVRAVYALITNQRGDHFIRHGAPRCSVTLALADGTVLTWIKARGRSGTYTVDAPDGYRVYDKTNGMVPDEVRALLRMSLPVAGEEFMPGFQRQHDAPFLLADTARRRAQVLGEFDGSNLLLGADGVVRRAQRADQQEATAQRAQALAATERAQGLDWVDAAQEAVLAATTAAEAAEGAARRVEAMRAARRALLAAEAAWLDLEALAAATEPPVVDADALIRQLHRIALMRDTLDQYRAAAAAMEQAASAASRPPPYLSGLLARWEAVAGQRALAAAHGSATAVLSACEADLAAAAEAQYEAHAALVALIGQSCPVCGQPLAAASLA